VAVAAVKLQYRKATGRMTGEILTVLTGWSREMQAEAERLRQISTHFDSAWTGGLE
jgi:hypothetical protein